MAVDDGEVVDVDADNDRLRDSVDDALQAEEAGVRAELTKTELEQEGEKGPLPAPSGLGHAA